MHSTLKVIAASVLCFGFAQAATVTVPLYLTADGNHIGKYVGTVVASDTQYGLLLTPKLAHLSPGLTAGIHGFHVHVNPSCFNNGMAAGGHLDPAHTDHHYGPYNPEGHLGDLPALTITAKGDANLPVLAPKLKVSDILGHSLMIHNGGDNYSDTPTLGGGGPRMACGIIPSHAD